MDDTEPLNGYDIQTTLDINLQDVAETALLQAMQQHNADDGLVIVMEVATGEVKAISNYLKMRLLLNQILQTIKY